MTNGEHRCIICGLEQQKGLLVREQFICEQCEKVIVNTTPKDEAYDFLVQRVKQLWVDCDQKDTMGASQPSGKPD